MSYYGSPRDTPGVMALLATFCVIFLLSFFGAGPALFQSLYWPVTVDWVGSLELWRPFTFPFYHPTFFHLLADGLVLYFFGGSLERGWGTTRFLAFFFLSGLVAGLAVLALAPFSSSHVIFYGMAGSWVAVVVAFAFINPYATVLLYFFPVQARWLGALSVAIELFANPGRYGGPLGAVLAVASVCLFAYIFTTRRIGGAGSWPRFDLKQRWERWRQRRRMKGWQRRVGRIERPEDLFKD